MAIVIQNMGQLKKALAASNLVVMEGAREAITDMTTVLARKSNELVPFDTGNLARSIVIKYPTVLSDKPEGSVAYGGTGAPYAVVQHEDTSLSHPPKAKGGSPVAPGSGRGPKYLEYPLKRMAVPFFNKKLIKEINKAIKKMSL